MPFPEKHRVSYGKNPLDKVICQLRFPPILKIDAELPSAFQEFIRMDYPLYSEKVTFQQEIAIGIKPHDPQEMIRRFTNPSSTKNHEFCSQDRSCRINLTRTSLSMSITKYACWEDFIRKFKNVYDAFLSLYPPPFFIRIGLRYIDIIDRSKLGLTDVNWNELLQPYFLGLLAKVEIEKNVKSFNNIYELNLLDNESFLKMSTSFVQNAKTGEKCFMVDSDFNTPKRTDPNNVFSKLEFLHVRANRLIQWIITEKLHNALEPRTI